MSRKTLLTLSAQRDARNDFAGADCGVCAIPRSASNGAGRGLRRSQPEVLRHSRVHLPWGLAVRPMPASAVRLLGSAPALVLAAI